MTTLNNSGLKWIVDNGQNQTREIYVIEKLHKYPGQDQKGNQAQGTHAQAWNVARNELKELMKPQKLHGDFAIWILSVVVSEEGQH
jgi:predicted kinase